MNICRVATLVEEKKFEAPEMTCVTFMDSLEMLKKYLKSKIKNAEPKSTNREKSSPLNMSGASSDYEYLRYQIIEVELLIDKLKAYPIDFNVTKYRNKLKTVGVLKIFDDVIFEQQNEYDHLVNDLTSVNNFIYASKHTERHDSIMGSDMNFTTSRRSKHGNTNLSRHALNVTEIERKLIYETNNEDKLSWYDQKPRLCQKTRLNSLSPKSSTKAVIKNTALAKTFISKSCVPKIRIDNGFYFGGEDDSQESSSSRRNSGYILQKRVMSLWAYSGS